MNATELYGEQTIVMDFALSDQSGSTAIAVQPSPLEKPAPALQALREAFMSLPAEQMRAGLSEYQERRKTFREWLLSQLKEGVHYGYPPGLEPKWCDAKGKPCPKEQAVATLGYRNSVVPLESWTVKPSLYAAGADFVCDLLFLRAEFSVDMEAWEQAGKVSGMFFRKCKLYSRTNGEFLGEGTGARTIGQKNGDCNNAIKMADKCGLVAAVLSVYGLRDLFTQDLETLPPPKHDNPEQIPDPPKAQPRDDRVTKEEVAALVSRWKVMQAPDCATVENWKQYVCGVTNAIFPVSKYTEWTPAFVRAVDQAIREDFGN